MKAVLEVIGGSSCDECSGRLIQATRTVVNAGPQDTGTAERDRLYKATESVLTLPIMQERSLRTEDTAPVIGARSAQAAGPGGPPRRDAMWPACGRRA